MAVYSSRIILGNFMSGHCYYTPIKKILPIFLKKFIKNTKGIIYRNTYIPYYSDDFLCNKNLIPLVTLNGFYRPKASLSYILKNNVRNQGFTFVDIADIQCYIGPGCILDKNFNPLVLVYLNDETLSNYLVYINPNIYNNTDKLSKHISNYLIPSFIQYYSAEILISLEINSLIVKNDKPEVIEDHSKFILDLLEKEKLDEQEN